MLQLRMRFAVFLRQRREADLFLNRAVQGSTQNEYRLGVSGPGFGFAVRSLRRILLFCAVPVRGRRGRGAGRCGALH